MPCPFSNNYPNRIPAVTVSGERAARLFHMANNVGQTAGASHAALDPRLSVILRLAEALETTPQELLTDPGEAPVQNAPKRHARLI